jgi:4-diphosphocytidyl-2-C-methyl-D-erythritol kinase
MSDGAEPGREGNWDLRAQAPAKLNLGLEVVRRRPDGFHDLRTVFQAIDLCDDLWLRERREPGLGLAVEGPEPVPAGSENLVARAGALLARRRAPGRGAEILLTKRIPAGAGLGGGSSDAAATLVALEALWGLDPDPEERARLALELGSDVPFFLLGGTALGEGRGEILTPLPAPPPCGWLVAVPPFRVSTADAFREVSPALTRAKHNISMVMDALREGGRTKLFENLVNDLEVGVVRIQPRLASIRRDLLSRGALAVGLTGSGSSLFALTRTQGDARRLQESLPPDAGYALIGCAPVTFGARVVSRER